jgi:hypothetical protein
MDPNRVFVVKTSTGITGSKIIVPAEPFDLRTGIPVDDIALLVLEIPRDDDQDITFTDPDFLFDLPFDPSHPGDTIKTPDADMVGTHHQFGTPEHLTVTFLG